MRRKWIVGLLVISSLLVFLPLEAAIASSNIYAISDDLTGGPYIDKIVYQVIEDPDTRLAALFAGVIEMDLNFFEPENLPMLAVDPDADIMEAYRNGYGHITINCRVYPLNISGFRRAFAYAFNKEGVMFEIMEGFSRVHDSLLPYVNPWCVEEDLEPHYYEEDFSIGNQILDDLGFEFNMTTGFRMAPNGESFKVTIAYLSSSEDIYGNIARIGVEALTNLGIEADTEYLDYYCCLEPWSYYNMALFERNFQDYDVTWLASKYWSENANDVSLNPSGFSNSSFDSLRNQLLHSTSFEEVSDAIAEMQRILHYNVPELVVYQRFDVQAYRNDVYTGHVEDLGRYITGPWTMLNIKKIDGTYGGTVAIGVSEDVTNFNFFDSVSYVEQNILDNLHLSLYTRGSDLQPYPRLASSTTIETHEDNPSVTEGYTRLTFDIVDNIKWSDGVQVTADDVVFTFLYALESQQFGNPFGEDLWDMTAAYAPTKDKAVLEFCSESYWHLEKVAFDYILPKHAFERSPEEWEDWNPFFNESDQMVNCGPFVLTDYELGEFYELIPRDPWDGTIGDPVCEPLLLPADDVGVLFSLWGINLRWNFDWTYGIAVPPIVSYAILISGEEYAVGTFETDWYTNEFSYHISKVLPPGEYNITLILRGFNSASNDTIKVTIWQTGVEFFSIAGITLIGLTAFVYNRGTRRIYKIK